MESSILNYLKNKTTLASNIVKMPLYCSDLPIIMFCGKIGVEFLKMSRANSKTEDLSHNCKQLLSRMLKQT